VHLSMCARCRIEFSIECYLSHSPDILVSRAIHRTTKYHYHYWLILRKNRYPTNHSRMSGESKYVCPMQNWILYPMVSFLFTGYTCEWSYSLHNKVSSPILANYYQKVISSESLKHVRWISVCVSDAELNSLSNSIFLIHRTHLWRELFPIQ